MGLSWDVTSVSMCEALEGMNATLCSGQCAFVESQNHKERPGWGCLESAPCIGPGQSSYSHLDVFVDLPSVLYRQSPTGRTVYPGFYPNCYILGQGVGRNSSWLILQLHFLSLVSLNTAGVFRTNISLEKWELAWPHVTWTHCLCPSPAWQQLTRQWAQHAQAAEVGPGPLEWEWVNFNPRASEKKTVVNTCQWMLI